MTFRYPFALLGLIAIPILIIIYIIRNKYKEVTAPTTYIWEVAAKMLKRKNPFSAKIPFFLHTLHHALYRVTALLSKEAWCLMQ